MGKKPGINCVTVHNRVYIDRRDLILYLETTLLREAHEDAKVGIAYVSDRLQALEPLPANEKRPLP